MIPEIFFLSLSISFLENSIFNLFKNGEKQTLYVCTLCFFLLFCLHVVIIVTSNRSHDFVFSKHDVVIEKNVSLLSSKAF